MIDFRTQFAIDKAANSERVDLMKRAGAVTPEDALRASIQSGMEDDSITNKQEWVATQTAAYKAHIAKGVIAFQKGASEMSTDEILIKVAKVAQDIVDGGAPTEFPKSALYLALKKRAFDTRRAGRSDDQAISDCLNGDQVGKLIFSAMRFAKGAEVIEPPPEPRKEREMGPAGRKMQAMADLHFKAHPNGSPAASYAAVFTHPDHRQLADEVKREDLRKSFEALNAA
jgi:hypothetical protein